MKGVINEENQFIGEGMVHFTEGEKMFVPHKTQKDIDEIVYAFAQVTRGMRLFAKRHRKRDNGSKINGWILHWENR